MQNIMKNTDEELSGDRRYPIIENTMQRFDYQKTALLEVLNTAQELYGYLSKELLVYIATKLDIPLSQVYGVATFYHMYTMEPTGDHHCFICTDPACSIAGAEDLLVAGRSYADAQTKAKITIEHASCLGLCDQAPAALNNGVAYVDLHPNDIAAIFYGSAPRARLQVSGEPRLMTRLIGELDPTDLEAHRTAGAFTALEKALVDMTPEAVEKIPKP